MELITITVSVFLFSVATFRAYLFFSFTSWKSTRGEVVKFSKYHDHEYNLWPKIEYSYQVEDKEFTGNRIFSGCMGGFFGWYKWIENLKEEYQVGTHTTVLYNPKSPRLSCLKKGSFGGIAVLYSLSVFFFLLSCNFNQ